MSAIIVSLPASVSEVLNPAQPQAVGLPGAFPAMMLPWPDVSLPAPPVAAGDVDGGSDLPADGNSLPPAATWLPLALPLAPAPAVPVPGEGQPATPPAVAAGAAPPALPATPAGPAFALPAAAAAAPQPPRPAILMAQPPAPPAETPPVPAMPPATATAPATAPTLPAATATPPATAMPPEVPRALAGTGPPGLQAGVTPAGRDAAVGRRPGSATLPAALATARNITGPPANAGQPATPTIPPGAERLPPAGDPGPLPAGVAEPPADMPLSAGAATATASSLAPPAQPAPQAAATLQLPEAVGSERFGEQLSERVSWMVDRDLRTAQLKLNPPQLGPVEVRVQVNGDQASVSFTAHNFAARDALEQAMPRLREMLGAQGYVQVNVNVSQHSFSERPAQPAPYDVLATPAADAGRAGAPPVQAARRAATSLLDAYA
jgi:flagellar hook-length control protein FliK